MTLFHGETHTLATTAGKIIIYTLATTLSNPHSSGNPRLARTGSGKAPLHGQDPHGQEDQAQVDEVQSQLEQLVDLLEQYFHPSNNGRSVHHNLMQHAWTDAWTDCTILDVVWSLEMVSEYVDYTYGQHWCGMLHATRAVIKLRVVTNKRSMTEMHGVPSQSFLARKASW